MSLDTLGSGELHPLARLVDLLVKETRIDEREATVLRDLIIRGDYVLKTVCKNEKLCF